MESENESNYLIQIETKQSSHIKGMFSVIKSQVDEVNIVISDDMLEILQTDVFHTFFVHVELFSGQFDKFICHKPIKIGVNISNIDKILKGVIPKDILTIFVEDPTHSLNTSETNSTYPFGFLIEKPDAGRCSQLFIDPIDVDSDDYQLANLAFSSYEITLSSTDLCDIVNQLKALSGEVVRIVYNKDRLSFYTKGEFGRGNIFCDKPQNNKSMKIDKTEYSNDGEIISIYVKVQKLIEFSKCAPMSTNVKIYLNKNQPLVLEYDIGNLGKIKLGTSICDKPEDW